MTNYCRHNLKNVNACVFEFILMVCELMHEIYWNIGFKGSKGSITYNVPTYVYFLNWFWLPIMSVK